ncbi:MAG: hypothetical protein AAF732_23385 [Pseudomonadota bacterium]
MVATFETPRVDTRAVAVRPVLRFALRFIGYAFATVLLIISAMMNWQFGLTLGATTVEQYIFAVASLAVDGLKAILPLLVLLLWSAGHRAAALLCSCLWLLCFSWSMASAIGFTASSRDGATAERSGDIERRQSLQRREQELRSQLARVPAHRASNVVRAALETVEVDIPVGVIRRTRNCTRITRESSRRMCAPALRLRRELAAAEEAAKLQSALVGVTARLNQTAGQTASADPQVQTLARLTNLSMEQVRIGLACLISILLELASAFGFAAVATATNAETMRRIELRAAVRLERDTARAARKLANAQKPRRTLLGRAASHGAQHGTGSSVGVGSGLAEVNGESANPGMALDLGGYTRHDANAEPASANSDSQPNRSQEHNGHAAYDQQTGNGQSDPRVQPLPDEAPRQISGGTVLPARW